jgi:4-amino-4-deoxy-L-arabinose transferase-like glycosyltransferase
MSPNTKANLIVVPRSTEERLLLAGLILAILVGVTLRVKFTAGVGAPGGGDARYRYNPIAKNLINGKGFSLALAPPYAPEKQTTPGYPYFMAALYSIHDSPTMIAWSQVVLDAGTVFLLWLICGRLSLPPRVKHLAVMIGLLCPILPWFDKYILSETLATFLLTGTVYLFILAIAKRLIYWWIASGFVAGLTLLTRPDTLPCIILLLITALFLSRQMREVVVCAALIALALLPWTVRNFKVFGEFLPLGSVTEQTNIPYVRWLDTWLDDPDLIKTSWWEVDQNSRLPDSSYVALEEQARKEHPIRSRILVPAKRLILTWYKVPSYLPPTYERPVRVLWPAFLIFVVIGIGAGLRTTNWLLMLPMAVLVGRTILPLLSALGSEPRYMFEALPLCFLFAASGLNAALICIMTVKNRLLNPHPFRKPLVGAGEL